MGLNIKFNHMKHVFLALAAAVSLLFANCTMMKQQSVKQSSVNIVGKKWQLTSLNGKEVAATINGKTPYLLLDSTGNRFSATAGCNGLGGEFTLGEKQSIALTRGMSTMMACENMEIEQAFGGVFVKVAFYKQEAEVLHLLDAENKVLATFKLLPEVTGQATLDGSWTLDYISGPRIAFNGLYPNEKPFLTFDSANAKVSGHSSCNSLNGKITVVGSQLKFGALASTKMACAGGGESLFLQTLEKINSYSVHDNTLTLIMGDIAVMRFIRK